MVEVQEPGQGVALGGQGAPQQVHPLPEDLIPPHLEVARETQATKRPLRLTDTGLQEAPQGTLELAVTMGHQAKAILLGEQHAKEHSGQEMGGAIPESLRRVRSLSSWTSNSLPPVKRQSSFFEIPKTAKEGNTNLVRCKSSP